MSEPSITLKRPSFTSLLVRPSAPNLSDLNAPHLDFGVATGIVTFWQGSPWLITAGHVVTGRHAQTGKLIGHGVPRHLCVRAPHPDKWDVLHWLRIPLYEEDSSPRWKELPRGIEVDVVAVPLPAAIHYCGAHIKGWNAPEQAFPTENLLHRELDWKLPHALGPISLDVTDHLFVVGHPFGERAGAGLAVWKEVTIATEPQFDFDGLPMFLIDGNTRAGQSGAPVIFFSRSGVFPTVEGVASGLGSDVLRFVGLYSGRIAEHGDRLDDAQLGRAFHSEAVMTVLKVGPVAPQRD